MCRWFAVAVAVAIFFVLLSVVGNVHVGEFYGSLAMGIIGGIVVYFLACGKRG
jgi:hypothetical protein